MRGVQMPNFWMFSCIFILKSSLICASQHCSINQLKEVYLLAFIMQIEALQIVTGTILTGTFAGTKNSSCCKYYFQHTCLHCSNNFTRYKRTKLVKSHVYFEFILFDFWLKVFLNLYKQNNSRGGRVFDNSLFETIFTSCASLVP